MLQNAAARAAPEPPAQVLPPESEEQWERIQKRLRAELGTDIFDSLLSSLKFEAVEKDVVRLSIATAHLELVVKELYAGRLLQHWQKEAGSIKEIRLRARLHRGSLLFPPRAPEPKPAVRLVWITRPGTAQATSPDLLTTKPAGGSVPNNDRDLVKPWGTPVEPKPRLTVDLVQRFVAKHYGVAHKEILGTRRTANFVRPRQIAMYLCTALMRRSLPEFGRRFGGRDHTTILYAKRKIEDLISKDPAFAKEMEELKQQILQLVEPQEVPASSDVPVS